LLLQLLPVLPVLLLLLLLSLEKGCRRRQTPEAQDA
jgi:hypothetical protein